MRAAVWLSLLLLGVAPGRGRAQQDATLLILPSTEGDVGAALFLARVFDGARLRDDLTLSEAIEARDDGDRVAVLQLDLGAGTIRAVRRGSGEVLARELPSGELTHYAIAVLSAELLALPLAAPTEPAPAQPGEAEPTNAVAVSAEARADAEPAPADPEPVAAPTAPETPVTAAAPATSPPAATDPEVAPVEADGDAVTLRVAAGYELTVADGPLTAWHRPFVRVGLAYGRPVFRGTLHLAAALFGGWEAPSSANGVDRLGVARNDVRGGVGVVFGALDPVELSLDLAAGVGLTQAQVIGDDGAPRVAVERWAFTLGGEASVEVRLIAGLRLWVGGGAYLDPAGERLLVRGEALASDGPWLGVARAGLRWETE